MVVIKVKIPHRADVDKLCGVTGLYFRMSSKAPPATFPEGHDPGDVKQET